MWGLNGIKDEKHNAKWQPLPPSSPKWSTHDVNIFIVLSCLSFLFFFFFLLRKLRLNARAHGKETGMSCAEVWPELSPEPLLTEGSRNELPASAQEGHRECLCPAALGVPWVTHRDMRYVHLLTWKAAEWKRSGYRTECAIWCHWFYKNMFVYVLIAREKNLWKDRFQNDFSSHLAVEFVVFILLMWTFRSEHDLPTK